MIYPTMIEVETSLLEHLQSDRLLTTEWEVEFHALPGDETTAFSQLFTVYPAIGTYACNGELKADPDQSLVAETALINLVCAASNQNSPGLARRGDGQDPGAIHLVERCRSLVEVWQPKGNVTGIKAAGWSQVWADSQLSICVLTVEVTLTRPKVRSTEELEHYGSTI